MAFNLIGGPFEGAAEADYVYISQLPISISVFSSLLGEVLF
jgi:hypothetical protein